MSEWELLIPRKIRTRMAREVQDQAPLALLYLTSPWNAICLGYFTTQYGLGLSFFFNLKHHDVWCKLYTLKSHLQDSSFSLLIGIVLWRFPPLCLELNGLAEENAHLMHRCVAHSPLSQVWAALQWGQQRISEHGPTLRSSAGYNRLVVKATLERWAYGLGCQPW